MEKWIEGTSTSGFEGPGSISTIHNDSQVGYMTCNHLTFTLRWQWTDIGTCEYFFSFPDELPQSLINPEYRFGRDPHIEGRYGEKFPGIVPAYIGLASRPWSLRRWYVLDIICDQTIAISVLGPNRSKKTKSLLPNSLHFLRSPPTVPQTVHERFLHLELELAIGVVVSAQRTPKCLRCQLNPQHISPCYPRLQSIRYLDPPPLFFFNLIFTWSLNHHLLSCLNRLDGEIFW